MTVLLILALSGCGGQEFDYRPATEIPPGPGLITGPRGAFVWPGPDRTVESRGGVPKGLPGDAPPGGEYSDPR